MDCFYVSVERLHNPSLIGKACAVGGTPDGRGVVAAASYEARAFGVRSAMPMGQALRLCPHLIVIDSGYGKYAEYSAQVRETLESFTPLVEMASQDEAYLDLGGTELLWGPPLVAAERIRGAVAARTKLPCTISVASSKLVAKVASDLAKPRGLLLVPHGSEEAFLAPLPIGRLPGVGPRTQERLHAMSLKTIGDIAAAGEERLTAAFGEHGRDLHRAARGIGSRTVTAERLPKSISAEETFSRDATDVLFLEGMLSNLAEKVAARLREQPAYAHTVSLKYRYQGFETHTAAQTLAIPTDDEVEISRVARGLFHANWDRRPIRLLGVAAGGLLFGDRQLDLLAEEGLERQARLHRAIDAIRDKHGYGSVRRAASAGRHEKENDRRWG